ncbi:MAG TPA: phosphatase PAP2 family protein [Mycobacteriales bacterium]|nr:phosphatase PAP2 family protein [Mycobacteriales bacterium]
MTATSQRRDEAHAPGHASRWGSVLRLAVYFVLLVAAFAGLGLLIVHVLSHGIVGADDRSVERTLAHHRTPTLNSFTAVTTWLAETPTIVVLTAALALTARLVWKRWRDALFVVVAVAGETSAFVLVTLLVHRPRPPVHHLDAAPPTSSFPSGHTAASVAFYGAAAVLCSPRVRAVALRVLLWLLAIAVPVAVAVSRMYRGMHFPTDVASGAMLGLLWLTATTLVFRPNGVRDTASR